MKELTQIRDAVIAALENAGMTALTAYPAQPVKCCQEVVAAVAVGTAQGSTIGFCNYLGEIYDDTEGTVREVYGKQLNGTIIVDIRAQSASACELGCETAAQVLDNDLPESIRMKEMTWEALAWEKETGMFVRRCILHCQALFVAKTADDETTFLDFQLKGVHTT